MGRVKVLDQAKLPFQDVHPNVRVKELSGGDEGPWVLYQEWTPNFEAAAHSHTADELICVLEGEMHLAGEICHRGSVLFVEKGTIYGPLKAGAHGVKFLNIRTSKIHMLQREPA